jgi:ABC-2 type transport system ATP-binding protein
MLSIKQLSHTYPNGVKALNNITLAIPKGMFGLLGPNGAGKSSLMRTLATLQQPTSGEITFNDVNLLKEPMSVRQSLGYLPQDFGVYPRGSAYELLNHIAMLKGFINRKTRKKVVEALLVKTNLFDVRKKNVATFSGGMRQRFGIAQALIGQPKLIIVDEPTAGLDPEERNRFHNLLSEIGEEIVVILSTHIVDDVADLCSNMAVLAQGEIISSGTPKALMEKLNGRIWKKTIDKSQLVNYENKLKVISSQLSAGKVIIRVESSNNPGEAFSPAVANLEYVYFIAINASNASENNEPSIAKPSKGIAASHEV